MVKVNRVLVPALLAVAATVTLPALNAEAAPAHRWAAASPAFPPAGPGCSYTVDGDKNGISGICRSSQMHFYRISIACGAGNTPQNGPQTPVGKPSSVRCPRGQRVSAFVGTPEWN